MTPTELNKRRRALRASGRRLEPSWDVYHDLGAELAQQLPAHCSYQQIGDRLGIPKQAAYHETVLALGKLAWRLRQLTPGWK